MDRFKGQGLPRLFSAALMVAVVMVFGSAVGVAAAPSSGSQSGTFTRAQGPVKTITATLTLDCAHLSAEARKYATAHSLCAGGAGTNDRTPPGDCGTSQIYVYNAYNSNAQFDWGFDSTQGTVVGHALTIGYQINGGSASFDDIGTPFVSVYRNSETRWTGTGYLTTQLTGTVLLWWGATCTVAGASDWDNISG